MPILEKRSKSTASRKFISTLCCRSSCRTAPRRRSQHMSPFGARNSNAAAPWVSRSFFLCHRTFCVIVLGAGIPFCDLPGKSWVIDAPAVHADALLLLGTIISMRTARHTGRSLFRHGVAPIVVASGRRFAEPRESRSFRNTNLIERRS